VIIERCIRRAAWTPGPDADFGEIAGCSGRGYIAFASSGFRIGTRSVLTSCGGGSPGANANAPISVPEGPGGDSPTPPHRQPGAGAVLTLVNGVLAGVGGVYVSTRSVLITVIAAIVAVVLAMMLVLSRR
jgi:hypothetical protein